MLPLILTDVFEKVRSNSLKNCGLCPNHYLSAPGLSWDAMLKMTKIKLELSPDPDMFIFFEKGTISEFIVFPIDIAKPTGNN